MKSEDALKIVRNELDYLLTRTVKVLLQKQQQSPLITRQPPRKQAQTSRKPEYNFFLNPDRLSRRNNVASDKVNARPDIRQNLLFLKKIWTSRVCVVPKNNSEQLYIDKYQT